MFALWQGQIHDRISSRVMNHVCSGVWWVQTILVTVTIIVTLFMFEHVTTCLKKPEKNVEKYFQKFGNFFSNLFLSREKKKKKVHIYLLCGGPQQSVLVIVTIHVRTCYNKSQGF